MLIRNEETSPTQLHMPPFPHSSGVFPKLDAHYPDPPAIIMNHEGVSED